VNLGTGVEMKITSNPNDPEFRNELRELGVPNWYPQNAPRHTLTVISEQYRDGTWRTKLVCPICGWEKHFVSGEKGSMRTVNAGDRWALHNGSSAPELFHITGLSVNPANGQGDSQSLSEDKDLEIDGDSLKPFEDFLGKVE